MDFIRNLVEFQHDTDEFDIMSKIKAAEKSADDRTGTKGFALENEDGSIVKVFVKAEQAEDFERVLSRALYDDEGVEVEIPELLFQLRKSFDIVDVEWGEGSIPEDEEEIEPEMGGEEPSMETGDEFTDEELEGGEGEEPEMDAEENLDDSLADFEGEDESDAYSALDKVIDMMKADAEAKQAEAEAKKAQAEADLARESLKMAEYRAAQEEEILDMEAYNKRQQQDKKDADTREKLIKYRHDLKQNDLGESMKYPHATPEEEEILDMEDWEESEKKKKEAQNKRERLIKYRHVKKKAGAHAEDEEHAKAVNYAQKKDTDNQRGMSKDKAKGGSFCDYDHNHGTCVDKTTKHPQVKDTTKGDSGMSKEKARGSIRNKLISLAKARYYGEGVEGVNLKEMTFADFNKLTAETDKEEK